MVDYSMNIRFNMIELEYEVTQSIEFTDKITDVILNGNGVKKLDVVCKDNHVSLIESNGYYMIPSHFIQENSTKCSYITIKYSSRLEVSQFNGDDYFEMINWYPTLHSLDLSCHDCFINVSGIEGYNILGSGIFNNGSCKSKYIRTFGVVLSKKLDLVSYMYENVQMNCLISSENKALAQLLIEKAKVSLEFYKTLFGFYPYNSFSMIPGAEFYRGGFPIATSMVYIHGMYSENSFPYDNWIIAHEMGHQYWGEYVLGEKDSEWLMYGLGLMIDSFFYTDKDRGQYDKFQALLEDAIEKGLPTSLIIKDSVELDALIEKGYDYNTAVKHGKAFWTLNKLKDSIGDKQFFDLLSKIFTLFNGKVLTVQAFLNLVNDLNGRVVFDYIKALVYE